MKNYVYIRAGLPDFKPDWREGSRSLDDYMNEVRSLLSKKDNKVIDLICTGFDKDSITLDFYKETQKHPIKFIREFFLFDFNVRNAKVMYLNSALGREADKDVLSLFEYSEDSIEEPEEIEFEEEEKLQNIFEGKDILARERAIDDLYWDKIDELTLFNYLDFTSILGLVVKMQIIMRWLKLDEETGREMFRRLVDEVRGTFTGVNYNEK